MKITAESVKLFLCSCASGPIAAGVSRKEYSRVLSITRRIVRLERPSEEAVIRNADALLALAKRLVAGEIVWDKIDETRRAAAKERERQDALRARFAASLVELEDAVAALGRYCGHGLPAWIEDEGELVKLLRKHLFWHTRIRKADYPAAFAVAMAVANEFRAAVMLGDEKVEGFEGAEKKYARSAAVLAKLKAEQEGWK